MWYAGSYSALLLELTLSLSFSQNRGVLQTPGGNEPDDTSGSQADLGFLTRDQQGYSNTRLQDGSNNDECNTTPLAPLG